MQQLNKIKEKVSKLMEHYFEINVNKQELYELKFKQLDEFRNKIQANVIGLSFQAKFISNQYMDFIHSCDTSINTTVKTLKKIMKEYHNVKIVLNNHFNLRDCYIIQQHALENIISGKSDFNKMMNELNEYSKEELFAYHDIKKLKKDLSYDDLINLGLLLDKQKIEFKDVENILKCHIALSVILSIICYDNIIDKNKESIEEVLTYADDMQKAGFEAYLNNVLKELG
jgi:hypothetical protein